MSKKVFKKAIGALYKERKIRIEEDGIYTKASEEVKAKFRKRG